MRCPFCQYPLLPQAPECPTCNITFPRTVALLGATPRMAPMLADTASCLTPSEQSQVRKKITNLQRHFPQVVIQVVIRQLPRTHPFGLYAFWLFNAGAFAGESYRGKNNRVILLLIDPSRQEAALMPGYALENLLHPNALDHLLDLAGPVWAEGLWAEGIDRVLGGLDRLLAEIALPNELAATADGEF